MKKMCVLILLVCLFVSVNGRSDSELYVITAHPFNYSEENFESALWKYERDTLAKQIVLATSDESVSNLKLWSEAGYFTLLKKNTWKQEVPYDSLLIYNIKTGMLQKRSIKIKGFGVARLSNNFLVTDSLQQYILALNFVKMNGPGEIKHIGINLSNNCLIDSLNLNVFRSVTLTGYSGGEVKGADYIIACSRKEDGYLEMVVVGNRSLRPCFPYELPEEYGFGTYARQLVCINNDYYFVVGGNEQYVPNKLGNVPLFIYNKKSSQWHEKELKGSLPRTRGFSDWLCGYVGDNSKFLLNKPLPGSSLWKDRATGLSPEIRYRGMYAPGILYFYNPSTDVYFELETGQADSEVVLIQGDKVLYRVYDELYETDLIDGTKLGKSKLLLKDDRVPDIHWAFYKDNSNK